MFSSLPAPIVAQLARLGQALVAGVAQHHGAPLARQEAAVRGAVRAAVPHLLATVVRLATPDRDPGIATVQRRCPRCDRLVPLHSQRPRPLATTCGALTIVRPWYACATCQHGFAPADHALGVAPHVRLSPALEAGVVDLGAATTYREAAAVRGRLTGLAVAADTIRAHTTAGGEQIAAADAAAIAHVQATRAAAAPVDPVPGTRTVETDGAMVHDLDGWHEVTIGVGGGAREGRLVAQSYVAAREAVDQFGPRLLAETARRGARAVVRWEGGLQGRGLAVLPPVHVVGDGAPWIGNLAADHCGDHTEVLDVYHAAEHVWAVARAVYGDGTDAARVGATIALRALQQCGVAPVRAALTARAAREAPTAVAAAVVRGARRYVTANADRMDYPAMAARGVPIGSGAGESSAGHVVQHRMKRPGQRWSERGGRALLALRARRASGRSLLPAA